MVYRNRDITVGRAGTGDGVRPAAAWRYRRGRGGGDRRAGVCRILDNDRGGGDIQEWIKYSSYGIPFLLTPGDFNKDGTVDKDDDTLFTADYGSSNARADLNKDGSVTSADQTIFNASYATAEKGGRYKLSSSTIGNRKGYAGYEHEGFGNDLAVPQLAHVRNRVLHFGLGRWTRRDPLGYVDGMNLLAYPSGLQFVDPEGTEVITVTGVCVGIGIGLASGWLILQAQGTPCGPPGATMTTLGTCSCSTMCSSTLPVGSLQCPNGGVQIWKEAGTQPCWIGWICRRAFPLYNYQWVETGVRTPFGLCTSPCTGMNPIGHVGSTGQHVCFEYVCSATQ